MNYLGHIALAAPHPSLMAGGMLGDEVKGALPAGLPTELAAGVELHRRIDSFSDQHSELSALRKELPPEWYRFAGILLDLYTDHLLARNAPQMLGEPVEAFCQRNLDLISRWLHHFDASARRRFQLVSEQNWLSRYSQINFTSDCLTRIGQRIRFPNPLHQSSRIMLQHGEVLEATSCRIYADCRALVAEWLAENREPLADPDL